MTDGSVPAVVVAATISQLLEAGGAALYRMVAAEFAGPDGEDDLVIYAENYREEHRYCESDEGCRDILSQHAAKGERILTTRTVPLGPWCVYWWERFARGVRLEMEIGAR